MLDATAAVDAALVPGRLDRIVRHEPVAPALLWSEATSSLRELAWRGHLDQAAADAALARFLASVIERRSSRQLYEEAVRVAIEMGWAKTSDAEYVALARMLDCQLVTLDGRLRRGASRLVEIIGPREL